MEDRIVTDLIEGFNYPDEYIQSLYRRVQSYIEYTGLPKRYMTEFIDLKTATSKLVSLNSDIVNIINKKESRMIWTSSFAECGYITSTLIETYIKVCLQAELHLNSILYIDTNLLMSDYKRLMGEENGSKQNLVHRKDVLYKEIEEADIVFWDKFNFIETQYEAAKIYEILSIRYRKCLGNIFFVSGDTIEAIVQGLNRELLSVMDCPPENILKFTTEKYSHKKWELYNNENK